MRALEPKHEEGDSRVYSLSIPDWPVSKDDEGLGCRVVSSPDGYDSPYMSVIVKGNAHHESAELRRDLMPARDPSGKKHQSESTVIALATLDQSAIEECIRERMGGGPLNADANRRDERLHIPFSLAVFRLRQSTK